MKNVYQTLASSPVKEINNLHNFDSPIDSLNDNSSTPNFTLNPLICIAFFTIQSGASYEFRLKALNGAGIAPRQKKD